jgi:hypothetical protein
MQQRTAVRYNSAAAVYMITVQLQSKMYGWNEWLAVSSAGSSNAHMQPARNVVPTTPQQFMYMNCAATIKDAHLDGWLAWLTQR